MAEIEAAESVGALKQQTKEEAISSGLGDATKVIKSIESLGNSIFKLKDALARNNKDIRDIAQKRYDAGLLAKDENRIHLLRQGKLPVYYSGSNIREILKSGKLPFGWSKEVAVSQGFGHGVIAAERKIRGTEILQEEVDKIKRTTLVNQLLAAQQAADRNRQKLRLIDIIDKSVGLF